jgi:hypothetical protein
MAEARRAAALDLCSRLAALAGVQVFVDAPHPDDQAVLKDLGVSFVPQDHSAPFHFGRHVSRLCTENGWERLAYFGAASAPLLTRDALADIFDQARTLPAHGGVVNNLHSTDWLVLNDAPALTRLADRLPKDNMLGWILAQEAGYEMHAEPPDTAFRADLDTPVDVLMVGRHRAAGDRLRAVAQAVDGPLKVRVEGLGSAMTVPGNCLGLIGRASAHLWARLEAELPIWVRGYVEERGMVASGRLAGGHVRSLVAEAIETWGERRFVEMLSDLVQAAVWDTRVWMAHRGPWPAESDRWAADLGWVDQVEDPALRRLTQAILDSSVPVVTGGQGVVGGSLMALMDELGDQA